MFFPRLSAAAMNTLEQRHLLIVDRTRSSWQDGLKPAHRQVMVLPLPGRPSPKHVSHRLARSVVYRIQTFARLAGELDDAAASCIRSAASLGVFSQVREPMTR